MIVFPIPMAHPKSLDNYEETWNMLCNTLFSITQQTDDRYHIVVGISKRLPFTVQGINEDKVTFINIDMPPIPLHGYQELLIDKGLRIYYIMEWAKYNIGPTHYYMMDSDDYISYNLIETLYNNNIEKKHLCIIDGGILVDVKQNRFCYDNKLNYRCGSTVLLHKEIIYNNMHYSSWRTTYLAQHYGWRFHKPYYLPTSHKLIGYNLHNYNNVLVCNKKGVCEHHIDLYKNGLPIPQHIAQRFSLNLEKIFN